MRWSPGGPTVHTGLTFRHSSSRWRCVDSLHVMLVTLPHQCSLTEGLCRNHASLTFITTARDLTLARCNIPRDTVLISRTVVVALTYAVAINDGKVAVWRHARVGMLHAGKGELSGQGMLRVRSKRRLRRPVCWIYNVTIPGMLRLHYGRGVHVAMAMNHTRKVTEILWTFTRKQNVGHIELWSRVASPAVQVCIQMSFQVTCLKQSDEYDGITFLCNLYKIRTIFKIE